MGSRIGRDGDLDSLAGRPIATLTCRAVPDLQLAEACQWTSLLLQAAARIVAVPFRYALSSPPQAGQFYVKKRRIEF